MEEKLDKALLSDISAARKEYIRIIKLLPEKERKAEYERYLTIVAATEKKTRNHK